MPIMRYYFALFIFCVALIGTEKIALSDELNFEDYPIIKLRSLDKITARTMNIEAKVGSTVRFGDIMIKVQACRKPPPVEKNEAAGFLQIYQAGKTPDGNSQATTPPSQWIFSGWMYASSPALSAMDHPIYDVWVLDCLGRDPEPLPPPEEQVQVEEPQNAEPQNETPQTEPPKAEPQQIDEPQTESSGIETPKTENENTSPAENSAPAVENKTVPEEPSLNEILQPEKAVPSESEPVVEQTPPQVNDPAPLTMPEPDVEGIY